MAGKIEEKACIVCGMKSHRLDWQSVDKPICDNCKPKAPSPAAPSVKSMTPVIPTK